MSRARDLANLGDINASDLTTGTLGNTVQDNITRVGVVTNGTFNNVIGSSATFPNKNFFIAAYVVFDGTSDTGSNATQTILDSLNVTSVTRSGGSTGAFRVNLAITMANTNYVIIGGANASGSQGAITQYDSGYGAISATSFGIRVRPAGSNSGTYQNVAYTNVIVIGDR